MFATLTIKVAEYYEYTDLLKTLFAILEGLLSMEDLFDE